MKLKYPITDSRVRDVISSYPSDIKTGVLALRDLIFTVGADTEGVGIISETLKWGQLAYLTEETKAGTTIRLGTPKQGGFALYTHCQTSVISEFRDMFPDTFTYEGNRAVLFNTFPEKDISTLTLVIERALTYHLKNK